MKNIRFPQKTLFEFYCNEHQMNLEEYIKKCAGVISREDENMLLQMAEY